MAAMRQTSNWRWVPGAVRDAESFLEAHPATHERFDRVVRLVDGFETPFGLELLATVHWVATQEHAEDHERILQATYAWGPRKRQFTPAQIEASPKSGCGRKGGLVSPPVLDGTGAASSRLSLSGFPTTTVQSPSR